ncbi:unnamed protein product [Tilletia caries]|uniref:Uncharacterized protein n=3 Tax=Tilletia caries TaxID=13290 RepID=A0ABN7IST1_9BASI|nr:unnamed protein product [Tilletia caries]CAD7069577.1 unnamed protein product [Tilletia caries]
MNALVLYSDDEGEHDAPRTAVPATAMTSRTAPSPAKTVPSGTATGVGATAASKNMRAASHLLKSGSSSGSPLAVRQRAPLPSSGSSKLAEWTSAASGLGSASAGPSVSASRSYDGSSASASVPHERSPVAGSKGKERARENEMLSAGQYEAAYRSACRPPPRADGNKEWGLPSVPQEGADPELEARLANFHRLKASGTHFNSSLMRSQAFHNPHIYAKLVSFVDIEETGSNYKLLIRPGAWDSHDAELLKLGDARTISEVQKRMTEEKQAAQGPGKRSQIAFTAAASSTSATRGAEGRHRPSSSSTAKSRDQHQSSRDRHKDRERDYYPREREKDREQDRDRLREKDVARAKHRSQAHR